MTVLEGVRILGTGPIVDVAVEDGRIAGITPSSAIPRADRTLLPGLVDLHTHLREPGGERAETIETGTTAAAHGGFTDVFAMANTSPVTDSVELVDAMRRSSAGVRARVHVVAAATLGQRGERVVDVPALRRAGVRMFSDDGHCVGDDGVVLEILRAVAEHGGVFAQHAQSRSIVGDGVINAEVADAVGCAGWPAVGEEAIVARDIAISRATGGRLHVCHVSTAGTVDLIRWAKSVGAPVTAEVTPHHLVLMDRDAAARGPALKVNPPLRSERDVRALRAAVLDGTIDAIGTDHAPHSAESKRGDWAGASFGLTALETALPVVAEVFSAGGRTDWTRLAQVMSTLPAAIGGLPPVSLDVGSPADLCVVETVAGRRLRISEHVSRSQNSPFDGFPADFRVVHTVLRGRTTFRAG